MTEALRRTAATPPTRSAPGGTVPRHVLQTAAEPVPARRIPLVRRFLYAGLAALVTYGAIELAATAWWRTTVPSVFWAFEETGPAVRFDPATGYRVRGAAARNAKFVRGADPARAEIEYVGAVGGNLQGFPDRDDFTAARADASALRMVILGDSFTGGDLPRRWPDAAEDAARATGAAKLDLLNFSLTGIGLANWHAILTRVVAPEHYEADGVVFAVWGNDLARRFYVCDHGGGARQLGGRVPTWTPEEYPATRDEALRYMASWDGYVLPKETFAAALNGNWRPERPWKPYIATTLLPRALGIAPDGGPVGAVAPGLLRGELGNRTSGRGRLVAEIADTLSAKRLRPLVVRVPMIEELLARPATPPADDLRAFAEAIGAELLDGARAFDGLTQDEVRACWYPRDLHWNQAGSDRFASWAAAAIADWNMRTQPSAGDDR